MVDYLQEIENHAKLVKHARNIGDKQMEAYHSKRVVTLLKQHDMLLIQPKRNR